MDVDQLNPENIRSLTDGITAALAAVGGGGVFYAVSKFFTARTIKQWDDELKEHEKALTTIQIDIAVLKSNQAAESKRLEEKMQAMEKQLAGDISDSRDDLFVAHERIRMLASGVNDISKIQSEKQQRKKGA